VLLECPWPTRVDDLGVIPTISSRVHVRSCAGRLARDDNGLRLPRFIVVRGPGCTRVEALDGWERVDVYRPALGDALVGGNVEQADDFSQFSSGGESASVPPSVRRPISRAIFLRAMRKTPSFLF